MQLNESIHIHRREDLANLFSDMGFTQGAEIGVQAGNFSLTLLSANENLKLYCIDPWFPYAEDTSFRRSRRYYKEAMSNLSPYASRVEILRKTSKDALECIQDKQLDFVYIDGAHDFQNVQFDLENWSKKVKSGGIVSGHDYLHKPVTKNYGVVEAVDEYVLKYGVNLHLTVKDRHPSYYWVNP